MIIILWKKDEIFKTTRTDFKNFAGTYGSPYGGLYL